MTMNYLRGEIFKSANIFFAMFIIIFGLISPIPAKANYSCLNPPSTAHKDPIWSTSNTKDLKLLASWSFNDPEGCIVGMASQYGDNNFSWNQEIENPAPIIPTSWRITRDGEMTLVTAELEFPIQLLQSLPNRNLNGFSSDLSQLAQRLRVDTWLKLRKGTGYDTAQINGKTSLAHLWGVWFSKNQGLVPPECKPEAPTIGAAPGFLNSRLSWKILSSGLQPVVEISIQEDLNCIFLVHAGPLTKPLGLSFEHRNALFPKNSLAEFPFWDGEAPPYFNQIITRPDQLVQVGVGDFVDTTQTNGDYDKKAASVKKLPNQVLNHSDVVIRDGSSVKVTTTIDGTGISPNSTDVITIYTGYYWWYTKDSSYYSGGWTVTFSGNSWTARYSKGGSLPGGAFMAYTTRAIKIPIKDLFVTAEQRAADQQADAQAVADKIKADAEKSKKITITCTKGSKVKKVTTVKPKCPVGYKVKK